MWPFGTPNTNKSYIRAAIGPVVLLIALLHLLLVSCGVEKGALSDTATPEPQLRIDIAPEEYFHVFPFHLEWARMSADIYPSPEDGGKYQEALSKLRSGGMEALTDEERHLIVVVSWYARVMQTHTVKYRDEKRDQEGETISLMETQEQYEFKGTADTPAPHPLASRTTPLHKPQGTVGDEFVESYEIVHDGGQGDAIITVWTKLGDRWVCEREKASGPNVSLLVWPSLKPEFARAEPNGVENVNGRPAYRLRAGVFHSAGERPEYLWIDVETLIPVQEEYSIGEGQTKLVTIIEINGLVDVTPPDVDVPCPEQDFGEPATPQGTPPSPE